MSRASFPVLPRWPGLPQGRAGARAAAFVAGVVVLEIAIGIMIVDPRGVKLVLLGIGALAFAVVVRFPFAALAGFLFLTAAVLQPATFRVPIGPTELRLEELLLGALFIVAVARPKRAWWGGAAGAGLAAFLGIIAVSFAVTVASGRSDFSTAFGVVRPLGMMAVFFVVVRLFPAPRDVDRVLIAGAAVAATTGFVAIVLSVVPDTPLVTLLNSSNGNAIRAAAIDDRSLGSANRILLPGVALAYAVVLYVVVRQHVDPLRAGRPRPVLVAGMAAALLLSLNRNMWAGILVGLATLLVIAPRLRPQLIRLTVLLVAVTLAFVLVGGQVDEQSPLFPIVKRGESFLRPGAELQDDSARERRDETMLAVRAIRENPWTGIGPGVAFGRRGVLQLPGGEHIRIEQLWVHNQYIFMLLMGGVVALLAFLVFLGAVIARTAQQAREDVRIGALGATVVMIALSAILFGTFFETPAAASLGLVTGAAVALTSARAPREADQPREAGAGAGAQPGAPA